MVHTQYGSFNPVTGEGLPLNASDAFKLELLRQEIQKGEASGPVCPFDWDAFVERKFGPADDA